VFIHVARALYIRESCLNRSDYLRSDLGAMNRQEGAPHSVHCGSVVMVYAVELVTPGNMIVTWRTAWPSVRCRFDNCRLSSLVQFLFDFKIMYRCIEKYRCHSMACNFNCRKLIETESLFNATVRLVVHRMKAAIQVSLTMMQDRHIVSRSLIGSATAYRNVSFSMT